jgi:hypothetical protein
MPEPRTRLPGGIPGSLEGFARCRSDQAEVSPGELDWLPRPKGGFIPDVPPSLSFEPGEGGSVSLSVGWGMISLTVDVSVVGGNLQITSDNPLLPRGDLQKFQDDLNSDLRDNGKAFDKVEVVDGKLRMNKRPLAADVEETVGAVPAPVSAAAPPPEEPILGPGAPSRLREFATSWQGKATITAGTLALGVAAWFLFTDDGQPIAIPTTTTSSTTTTASTTTTTAATEPVSFDDPQLAAVVDGVGRPIGPGSPGVVGVSDPTGDGVDSISGRFPAYVNPAVDIDEIIAATFFLSESEARDYFNNSVFECGASDPVVVCAPEPLDVPEGEILMVAVQMAGEIPPASSEKDFIYSLVFDSDGDPGNDWVFNPPFDWDYFQGTDRWYQAVYSVSTSEWTISAIQVLAGNEISGTPTSVRAVISGDWIVWFVPESELPEFPGRLRASAFGHDGRFTESSRGGDVTGADPTDPLIDLTE